MSCTDVLPASQQHSCGLDLMLPPNEAGWKGCSTASPAFVAQGEAGAHRASRVQLPDKVVVGKPRMG